MTTPPKDPARWEQRYRDEDLPWDTGEPDIHLQQFAHAFTPGRVLEVGCGTGTNALWLESQGYSAVGVDLSPTAIARARAKAEAAGSGCQFLALDFLEDPVPGGPFGLVYDRGCFHVFDDLEVRRQFAARIAGLLGPGGTWHSLIGSTDGPPRDTGPPRLSIRDVSAALEDQFEVLSLASTLWDESSFNDARAWKLVARKRERYSSQE